METDHEYRRMYELCARACMYVRVCTSKFPMLGNDPVSTGAWCKCNHECVVKVPFVTGKRLNCTSYCWRAC